jgi:hypothetical protein
LLSQFGIEGKQFQIARQSITISHLKQKASIAMLDQFLGSANIARHGAAPARHGFQKSVRECFRSRREYVDVNGPHPLRWFRRQRIEMHRVRDAQIFGLLPEGLSKSTVPNKNEPSALINLRDISKGIHQQREILLLPKNRYSTKDGAGVSKFWGTFTTLRMELVRFKSVVAYADSGSIYVGFRL